MRLGESSKSSPSPVDFGDSDDTPFDWRSDKAKAASRTSDIKKALGKPTSSTVSTTPKDKSTVKPTTKEPGKSWGNLNKNLQAVRPSTEPKSTIEPPKVQKKAVAKVPHTKESIKKAITAAGGDYTKAATKLKMSKDKMIDLLQQPVAN